MAVRTVNTTLGAAVYGLRAALKSERRETG
jgi:hypothetical protein